MRTAQHTPASTVDPAEDLLALRELLSSQMVMDTRSAVDVFEAALDAQAAGTIIEQAQVKKLAEALRVLGLTPDDFARYAAKRSAAVPAKLEVSAGGQAPHSNGEPWSFLEAAAFLGVCVKTLERAVDDGRLDQIRHGWRKMIADSELRRINRDGLGRAKAVRPKLTLAAAGN